MSDGSYIQFASSFGQPKPLAQASKKRKYKVRQGFDPKCIEHRIGPCRVLALFARDGFRWTVEFGVPGGDDDFCELLGSVCDESGGHCFDPEVHGNVLFHGFLVVRAYKMLLPGDNAGEDDSQRSSDLQAVFEKELVKRRDRRCQRIAFVSVPMLEVARISPPIEFDGDEFDKMLPWEVERYLGDRLPSGQMYSLSVIAMSVATEDFSDGTLITFSDLLHHWSQKSQDIHSYIIFQLDQKINLNSIVKPNSDNSTFWKLGI